MMTSVDQIRSLSDDELLRRLAAAAGRSRRAEADLVAHIAEVDRRRLYRREATPSMFAYCTQRLHLSEHAAYLRIAVARASREHPVLLAMLADGRLHLTAIAKLAPLLTASNRDALLARATHRSKQEVEDLVAELAPRPAVAGIIRRLPQSGAVRLPAPAPGKVQSASGGEKNAPQLGLDRVEVGGLRSRPGSEVVEALAPARYRIQFTASAELRDKLERLRRLSAGDDLAEVIDQAVTEKLRRLEAKRFARTARPRKRLADVETTPASHYVPAPLRRAVYERDGGRCTYTDATGRRCPERDRLEFHHDGQPFGRGGDHSVSNLRLLCGPHNMLLAEREYGVATMGRYRGARDAGGVSERGACYTRLVWSTAAPRG